MLLARCSMTRDILTVLIPTKLEFVPHEHQKLNTFISYFDYITSIKIEYMLGDKSSIHSLSHLMDVM